MTDKTPYAKFAERMMQPDSVYIPKILQSMITDRQAEMLMSLPATAAQLSEKFGMAEDDARTDLEDMYRKGLTFKKKKDGDVLWRPPMHIAQFHDATIVWPEATEEFYELWRLYMEEEWPKLAPGIATVMPRPFTRVVPVGKSIDTGKAKVLAPENVKEILESASRIAVTKCTCRLTMKKCDAPVEVCLQINRGAEYTVDRGSGREISLDEAMKIIQDTEEAGLVHVTMNKADVGHFICNCCGCCCQAFSMLISEGVNLCDPSRYVPEVDADACSACGTCEDRCWFGAINLGDDEVAVVTADKCLGCGQCAIGCPEEAITMVGVRGEDFIPV
ncbi:MAG: 4Fe-4S binding protein [Thermodesulfobacteriota bacterium]|nr:4Fe-4S binding protein [Thermodesulfobacteriota bacterium]